MNQSTESTQRCSQCGGENGHHFQTCMLRGAHPAIDSTSDERVVNNVMRHEYKVLSDAEKIQLQTVKDMGLALFEYIDSLGKSRELSLAKTNAEQAVMWAVKHVTG